MKTPPPKPRMLAMKPMAIAIGKSVKNVPHSIAEYCLPLMLARFYAMAAQANTHTMDSNLRAL